MINPKMLNVEKVKEKVDAQKMQMTEYEFENKYSHPAPTSFHFSSHAKEMMKSNVPEEGKSTGKERREENKKVKANGKRGRGKGATE